MKWSEEVARRVRCGEDLPAPLAAALTAATPVTRIGMWWRKRTTAVRLPATVMSVGNITAGGTGKTPYVIQRAKEALGKGRRVAILTRGYGASPARVPVASAEVAESDRVRLLGDEAALVLKQAPDAIVVRDPNRVRGGRLAIDHYNCDTLILDDGYQYVQLARDENIVLIDATNPFGNGHLLPRGILREPVHALARATRIVFTRCDLTESLDDARDIVARHAPDVPVDYTVHAPTALVRLRDGAQIPIDEIRGTQIAAACALGNPEAFYTTLESLGAELVSRHTFPDHDAIPLSGIPESIDVVISEKDAVKLAHAPENFLALQIETTPWDGPDSES